MVLETNATRSPIQRIEAHRVRIDEGIAAFVQSLGEPPELYAPIVYTMAASGKRMRPLMTIIGAAMFGATGNAPLYAGIAVEVLHNFTLVHDDIMDKSLLRRGNPTVHTKWDETAAILSGDAMLGLSYRLLHTHVTSEFLEPVLRLFTDGFIEVCEGQALDIAYSRNAKIHLSQYLLMIEKKTARLPEVAALMGAVLGGASQTELELVRRFSRDAGIAFQIQDDLLDVIADQAELGKTVGQDLIEGKKTFLVLTALETVKDTTDQQLLQRFVQNNGVSPDEVPLMRELMIRHGVIEATMQRIEDLFQSSLETLKRLPHSDARDEMEALVSSLRGRRK